MHLLFTDEIKPWCCQWIKTYWFFRVIERTWLVKVKVRCGLVLIHCSNSFLVTLIIASVTPVMDNQPHLWGTHVKASALHLTVRELEHGQSEFINKLVLHQGETRHYITCPRTTLKSMLASLQLYDCIWTEVSILIGKLLRQTFYLIIPGGGCCWCGSFAFCICRWSVLV